MYRLLSATLVACLVASGCSRPATRSVQVAKKFDNVEIAEPVTWSNLTVFPVLSKTPQNQDRFITLDEGLAAGTVTITEVNATSIDSSIPEAENPFAPQPGDESPFEESESPDDSAPSVIDEQDPFAEQPANDAVEQPPIEAFVDPADPGCGPARQERPQVGSSVVRATEETDAPSVNQLLVLNTCDRPLYLMPGEVISGGQQDRTIGQEVVIAPGTKPVRIDVFCVEQGRWEGRSLRATTQILAAASRTTPDDSRIQQLADEASTDKFVARVGYLNMGPRRAVQDAKNQHEVWAKVAEANQALKNDSATGNFAAVYTVPNVANELQQATEALATIASTDRIVGVAIAVDGRFVSADVFESTPLFRKFWPKLLESYALDALSSDTQSDETNETEDGQLVTAAPKCTIADCRKYLTAADSGATQVDMVSPGQAVARSETNQTISFSYYHAADDLAVDFADSAADGSALTRRASEGKSRPVLGGMGMGGMGGMPAAVHSGTFSK